MTDEPENLTLRYLRRISEQVDRLGDDMREVKSRLGALEEGQASLSRRLDRMGTDVAQIQRRLDLVDAPA